VPRARHDEAADVVREADLAALEERARHHRVLGPVEQQRLGGVRRGEPRHLRERTLAEADLVDTVAGAHVRRIGERLGHPRHVVARERARCRPQPVTVEVGDVGSAALGRVELGHQPVAVGALAHEVVGLRARVHRRIGRDAGGGVGVGQHGRHRVEDALALDEAGEAHGEIGHHDTAHVARGGAAARVTEDVVDQREEVARVRRRIVEAVGRQVGVAVAAQVRDDHLEAGGGERRHVARPDALGLGVAVDEQQRIPADALTPEGEGEVAAGQRGAVDGEVGAGHGA
jgi:hypothetical protein